MPLPNPDYLSNEYFYWDGRKFPAVLVADNSGSPMLTGSKRIIRWDFLDSYDRQRVHDLIMGYVERNLGSPVITEATAITNFQAASAYHTVNYDGSIIGTNSTGLVADDTPATSGYQEVNVGGDKTGASTTGLLNDTTVYTASVAIDNAGSPIQIISIVGSAAQTYTDLLSEINTDLTGATASIINGNIVITSASTGITSTISITDPGPIGSPESLYLFSSLTGFVSVNGAVAGSNSIPGPGALYTASIIINSTKTNFTINGDDATTFSDLISALNTGLPAGVTASIYNGNIEISTNATGAGQEIEIIDGTLFKSTNGFKGMLEKRVGVTNVNDIFNLNYRNEYQTYASLLIGMLRKIPNKPKKAAHSSNDIYFNHGTGTWLYLYNDSTVT